MSLKWQATILILLILISVTITKLGDTSANEEVINTPTPNNEINSVSIQETSLSDYYSVRKVPTRDWNVFDPSVQAGAVIVHSIDDEIPLFYFNSREQWRLASITKLLTAVVVIEEIGLSADIPISPEAVATEGIAGDLKGGETYNSKDLLNIMILVSSNDAAAAFEEY
ncbi:MAG: serine hydrolase, partial [Candidatus Paceibacterota bacterium]